MYVVYVYRSLVTYLLAYESLHSTVTLKEMSVPLAISCLLFDIPLMQSTLSCTLSFHLPAHAALRSMQQRQLHLMSVNRRRWLYQF